MQKKYYEKSAKLSKKVYLINNKHEGTKKATQMYVDRFDLTKKRNLAMFIRPTFKLVAEENGQIIWVLRGHGNKLGSLFVDPKHQRKGVATKLYKTFEKNARKYNTSIHIKSSLFAIPFYKRLGFKKTTGIRSWKNLPVKFQPMKKLLWFQISS